METLQKTTEFKNIKATEATNWTRTTFNFHEGKAWCYRKKVKHPEYDREIEKGYYCANPTCKNELIFKYRDKREYWEQEPFKFHKLLVKILEKRDDDWRTGRKIHTYYAFCCKCAIKDKSDGTIKRKFGKVMGFEMEKCDCVSFIEERKIKAINKIINFNSMIEAYDELKEDFIKIKFSTKSINDVEKRGQYGFKLHKLDDFTEQLEKKIKETIEDRETEKNSLSLYNEWEIKRNQQLEIN